MNKEKRFKSWIGKDPGKRKEKPLIEELIKDISEIHRKILDKKYVSYGTLRRLIEKSENGYNKKLERIEERIIGDAKLRYRKQIPFWAIEQEITKIFKKEAGSLK